MDETQDLRASLTELVEQLAASDRRELPSLRELAAKFDVSPNTIKKVLLEIDGPIRVFAVHGRGFFVRLESEPEPGASSSHVSPEDLDEVEEIDDSSNEPIDVDEHYSPVPEEGRALRRESAPRRDAVVVIGQILRATDPTGAPSNRFLQFVRIREELQARGYQLSWAPLGYDAKGRLDPVEVKSLQLQLAGLGERLAGILLLDCGYGRSQPLWELTTEATDQPVVWFQTSPIAPEDLPRLPRNAHVLEPDWSGLGEALGDHLVQEHLPQKVLLLPSPGEKGLPPQLVKLRKHLLECWGPRWVASLDWFDVFPSGLPRDPADSKRGKLRRLLLDTGIARFELDRYFRTALGIGASLWVCADDLLALAAIDHLDSRHAPNEPRPGVLGFGNHPFSLARGLSTVDPGWRNLVDQAIALFTRSPSPSEPSAPLIIAAPSESVYGGNILARRQDWF
ncbi:MAG: GntR family transcriptional regulator [Fibrobacterota bacterium]|nr:GntR family transcriptional regulator [Fibrobacterota bacterium]QQS05259.1 MAG: GntR family transcriptional regulator [Fibrobacterota bacterium]